MHVARYLLYIIFVTGVHLVLNSRRTFDIVPVSFRKGESFEISWPSLLITFKKCYTLIAPSSLLLFHNMSNPSYKLFSNISTCSVPETYYTAGKFGRENVWQI